VAWCSLDGEQVRGVVSGYARGAESATAPSDSRLSRGRHHLADFLLAPWEFYEEAAGCTAHPGRFLGANAICSFGVCFVID